VNGVVASALLGAAFFLWIAGWRVVDPTQFEWLMKLDWRINFLGWHIFRNDPWTIPPGVLSGYLAGEGTTIGFTDSIPLAAMALKLFDPWLPTPFQYFGLWLLLCFAVQGAVGALIVRVYTPNVALQLAGAALFVLVPTLLMRVGHPALTAHFVLLWALWLYLRSSREQPASAAAQAAPAFVAAMIHPYLSAMTVALLAAMPLRDRTRRSFRAFAAVLASTVGGWWLAGFLSVSNATDLSAGGLGLYSMNLLSPITPAGWSTLLPEWPAAHPQQVFEGGQYLGAGVIGLLIVAVAVALMPGRPGTGAQPWPLVIICVTCGLYALSPRVTLGSHVVLDWTTAAIDRLAFFRASGRFFWPMAYLLVSLAIATAVSRLRPRIAFTLLAAALVLQFVDLRDAHAERRMTSRSEAFHTWPRQLVSPAWDAMLTHYDRLLLVPPSQCGDAPLEHEELAYLAGLHEVTINSGLAARWNQAARRRYCAELDDGIGRGEADDRAVYVVSREVEDRMRASAGRVVCGNIDVARVCVASASVERWRNDRRVAGVLQSFQ
jgi:hypothetical protein